MLMEDFTFVRLSKMCTKVLYALEYDGSRRTNKIKSTFLIFTIPLVRNTLPINYLKLLIIHIYRI